MFYVFNLQKITLCKTVDVLRYFIDLIFIASGNSNSRSKMLPPPVSKV